MSQDLQDRVFLVTGANTGIGRITALELAKRGAGVILACRSEEKTRLVMDEIREVAGHDRLWFVPLDLGDLASVRACAEAVNALDTPLHVLVANAGLAGQRGHTASGFELHFGVNHVGHALLIRLLLPKLKAAVQKDKPARVVIVASMAHRKVKRWDLTDVQKSTPSALGFTEYCVSKLANIYFAKQLASRPEGSGVQVYALHPGVVASDIWRRVPAPIRWVMKRFMVTVEEGARTQLHCATAPELAGESGLYYDRSTPKRVSKLADNAEHAADLWVRTSEWIGLPVELVDL